MKPRPNSSSSRLLVGGLLTATVLAACGNSTKSPTASQVTSTTAATTATTATTATVPAGTVTTVSTAGTATVPAGTATVPAGSVTLQLLSYDAYVEPDTLKDFTAATGINVTFVKGGADAGTLVNSAILTAGKPQGDVLFGIDNTLLSRGVGTANLFTPYASKELASLDPAATALVPNHEVTPIDTSDVCVNVDTAYFSAKGLTPPVTLDDLLKPAYKGLLVTENPGTSSTGLAFMLATVAKYGPDGFVNYWKQLRANGVVTSDSWDDAYFTEFSQGGSGGKLPIVVSYATSPPYPLVSGAEPRPTTPTTANLPDTCFRQIEFAGILKGSSHQQQAQQLIDFLAGKAYQESLPLTNFVYPIRADAAVPEVFTKFAPLSSKPWMVSPADIAKNRDAWIEAWTKAVLR